MKITQCFTVNSEVDNVWRALHETRSIAEAYGPVLSMRAVGVMPETLADGDAVTVALRAFDFLPAGRQVIQIRNTTTQHNGVERRTMHDEGGPLSGPLFLLKNWHHQMGVSRSSSDSQKTDWHDTLEVGGPVAFLYWPVLAIVWKLRTKRIQRIARSW
jgi:hypothetical protein